MIFGRDRKKLLFMDVGLLWHQWHVGDTGATLRIDEGQVTVRRYEAEMAGCRFEVVHQRVLAGRRVQ